VELYSRKATPTTNSTHRCRLVGPRDRQLKRVCLFVCLFVAATHSTSSDIIDVRTTVRLRSRIITITQESYAYTCEMTRKLEPTLKK
jgi:hypothetical protein